jgi:hypothetical protein
MPDPPEPVLPIVRDKVRELLLANSAFRSMPEPERRDLAYGMVRIASYIAGGERGDNAPATALIANALANEQGRPDTASGDLKNSGAAAAHEGAKSLDELVDAVEFPKFVGGLIDGVFNAIVTATIKQMEAFAELVKNVSKSVDDFMKDNVSQNQARDYLTEKYPDHLELDTSSGQPQVKKKADADDSQMPDFFSDLGIPSQGQTSIDDDVIEQQVVPAARKRLAMDRQQMLATMVLMGVNRILVTDGFIKASVVFDLSTKDAVQRANDRTQTATFHDATKESRRPGFFGWFSGYSTSDRSTNLTVQTVTTQKDESQSSVDTKAKLAGEVNVRFRTEAFPLEKMAELISPDMRNKGRLPQRQPAQQPAQPAGVQAVAPLPPMPALPGSAPAAPAVHNR